MSMRMLHAPSGSNHCFLEFAQEAAARCALDCSGSLLGELHPFSTARVMTKSHALALQDATLILSKLVLEL